MSATRQLVVFSLGDEEYALPIAPVHEIIRYIEPRSVASASDADGDPAGILDGLAAAA